MYLCMKGTLRVKTTRGQIMACDEHKRACANLRDKLTREASTCPRRCRGQTPPPKACRARSTRERQLVACRGATLSHQRCPQCSCAREEPRALPRAAAVRELQYQKTWLSSQLRPKALHRATISPLPSKPHHNDLRVPRHHEGVVVKNEYRGFVSVGD
jgi:hypothetical protein